MAWAGAISSHCSRSRAWTSSRSATWIGRSSKVALPIMRSSGATSRRASATTGNCLPGTTSMRSSSLRPITGTAGRCSMRSMPASTSTWRSRWPTASRNAGSWSPRRQRPAWSCRPGNGSGAGRTTSVRGRSCARACWAISGSSVPGPTRAGCSPCRCCRTNRFLTASTTACGSARRRNGRSIATASTSASAGSGTMPAD